MRTINPHPPSGRYLSFAQREEIAILTASGLEAELASRLGRSPSTISRELRRGAATRSGTFAYRATTARWHADRRAKRPKVAKLAANEMLREYVQERLAGLVTAPDGTTIRGPAVPWTGRRHGRRKDRRWARAWSPEQITNRLRVDYPYDESMRVSHEATYQALLRAGPRRPAPRPERLPADLARTTRAAGTDAGAGQELHQPRGPDQRAARRGPGPRRPRSLGG